MWELSPLYGEYLSLNVDNDNSSINFRLAVAAALFYGLNEKKAFEVVKNIANTVKENWQLLAKKYEISRGEIERMRPAFSECEKI